MPEFTIGQDRLDFDQLREALQAELAGRNSWTDIIDAATGQMILDFLAAIGAFNQQGIARALQERFFDTQVTPTATYRLARALSVHIIRKAPAKVAVSLTSTIPNQATIPAHSAFKIDGVDFFNREEINFVGQRWSGTLYQGSVQSQTVESSGQQYQRYQIGNSPYSVSDYFDSNAVNSSDGSIPRGRGDIWAEVGTQRFEQTRIGLWHYTAADRVFYENTRVDGRVEIQFGNNLYGVSPQFGQNVTIFWIETLGAAGNTATRGRMVSYVASTAVVGLTESLVTDGQDEQPVSFYKRFGADLYSTRRRAVNRPDYHALIATYPGVVDALIEGQQDIYERQTNRVSGIAATGDAASGFYYVTDRTTARVQVYARATRRRVASRDLDLSELNSDLRGVFITGNNGDRATATASVNSSGVVTGIAVTSGGSGYDQQGHPVGASFLVKIDPPPTGGTQATATATISGGMVTGISVGSGGSGYNMATPPTVTIASPIRLKIVDAAALRVRIYDIDPTSDSYKQDIAGYSLNPLNIQPKDIHANSTGDFVTDSNGTVYHYSDGANETFVVKGGIESIPITDGGSGYVSAPMVTIDGEGEGATAVAVITGGVVTEITITNVGKNYVAPTVMIGEPPTGGTQAQAGTPTLTPIELTGIWFDASQILLAFQDGRKLQSYNFSTKLRNAAADRDLAAANTKPTAIAADSTFLWVADDLFDGNQVYTYSWITGSPDEGEFIQLAFAGEEDIRWMNVVRIFLLTQGETSWTNAQWAEFIRWLKQRAIANVEYHRRSVETRDLNIDAEIYCFNHVDLTAAEQLIRQRLTALFAVQTGALGRSYYLSNIHRFIENIEDDQQERVVDYLTLRLPTENVIVQRHEYVNLTSLTLNVRYTERTA